MTDAEQVGVAWERAALRAYLAQRYAEVSARQEAFNEDPVKGRAYYERQCELQLVSIRVLGEAISA